MILRTALVIKIILLCFTLNNVFAQTYTTTSASCGKCGKSVSSNSRVGDTCPHCGVTWGRENSTTTSETKNINTTNSPTEGYKKVFKNSNFREYPNLNSYVYAVIPAFELVNVISSSGDWYKVYYQGNIGWIYKSNFEIKKVPIDERVPGGVEETLDRIANSSSYGLGSIDYDPQRARIGRPTGLYEDLKQTEAKLERNQSIFEKVKNSIFGK